MRNKIIIYIFTVFSFTLGKAQTVSTLAGSSPGYLDGPGQFAQFQRPRGICTDATGNVYVADFSNNRIRKITPTGEVSTIAGSGVEGYADGIGTAAVLGGPHGICIDNLGNLYVTDFWNFKIRKITLAGVVTTLAGSTQGFTNGTGAAVQFGYLEDICIDALGNLYVADAGNSKIRKITPSGTVTTVAGTTAGYLDGAGSVAKFDYPNGICIDASNNLYIAEYFGHKIRKISATGVVTTIAGSTWGFSNGQGTSAQFRFPTGIDRDANGNLYVADSKNNMIRKITPSGLVSTYTGSENNGYLDGSLNTALFSNPWDIQIKNNIIYISDGATHKIRKIDTSLSVEGFSLDAFVVYPNPNQGNFKISSNFNTTYHVVIYDFTGKLVFEKHCTNTSNEIQSNLKSGWYLVKISSPDNAIKNIKLLVN